MPEGGCDPVGSPRWSRFVGRTCDPVGDPHWTVSHGRDPTLDQGQSVRSSPPEEEGVAETTCDELTAAPIPRPPVLLGGRRERKSGVKLSLERRGGVGGRCFKIWFYFSLPYSDLIGDELN